MTDSRPIYMIASGFWDGGSLDKTRERIKFASIWNENNFKYTQKIPYKTVSIYSSSPPDIPLEVLGCFGDSLYLGANPGHSCNTNNLGLCGWRSSILMGAMRAASCGCDLVYKEQDCLCFGDWVEQIYQDAKEQNVKMLFGQFKSDPSMKAEISLVWIKNEFLIEFIRGFSDIIAMNIIEPRYPELEMDLFKNIHPDDVGYFSFGYGRDRPINYDDHCFFVQHIGYDRSEKAQQVFDELVRRELI